jgi:CubicO group peptidase (beta-lactamase class C family)
MIVSQMGKIHFINGQLQNPNPRMLKKVLIVTGVMLGVFSGFAQSARERWVDSTLKQLAAHEKLGQLFVLSVPAPATPTEFNALAEKIERQHPGGIEFTSIPYGDVKSLIRRLQAISKVPLLIGLDENLLLRRADSLRAFPCHLQLAAVSNDSLVGKVYERAASWLATQGIDYTTGMSLTPLRLNGKSHLQQNQVGGTSAQIEEKYLRWAHPISRQGLYTVPAFETPDSLIFIAKGDTIRINNLAQYFFARPPFAPMIRTTDFHFQIQVESQRQAAGRSGQFIQDVIRGQLQYKGLLTFICDKFNDDYRSIFLAGNQIISTPAIDARQLSTLTRLLRRNKTLKLQLDQSVRQLLALKYDQRQNRRGSYPRWQWQTPEKRMLFQSVFGESITVLKNDTNLPIKNLDFQKLGLIHLGQPPTADFETSLRKHAHFSTITIRELADTSQLANRITNLDVIVFAVFDADLSATLQPWLKDIAQTKKTIACHFAGVAHLDSWLDSGAVLVGYTATPEVQRAMAQNLFGVQSGTGVLPLTIPGIPTSPISAELLPRFAFTEPEAAGMDHEVLQKIEPIVQEAITSGATPGAQIIVARHGKVVYQKNFGTLTYTSPEPVTDSTLYDLASVTKVSATLQTIMFLHEKKLLDLNKKASFYLPELKNTNKEDMVLKDILTHQAGLWPFLPFWASTMKDSVWMPDYYQNAPSPDFPWPVAESLFARQTMKDSLWHWIIQSKVREKRLRAPYDYRYSDMGFYILQHLAEKMLNQPMEEFLHQNLYEPLGANTLGYLPRKRYPVARIAPTEQDKLFRKSLLAGFVHDQGAAMHGGVAGHAGLFGTGLDLAKLGQLWLNQGTYGDTQFFKPETIALFTNRQFESSRRGLGWDKPLLNDWNSPTALAASPLTFGHTGFTGTCVWVDPAFDLVYVFLSNRVHPDMNNTRLLNLNIRPRIQEVIYQSIFNYSRYQPTTRN